MEKVTSRVSTRSHTNFHPDAHASRTEAWTSRRRWGTVLTACIVTFAVSLDSTAILSAAEPLCEHFGVSEHDFPWTVFLVTTWTGGAALLPLIIFPLMEDFGIRKIYISAYLIFLVLVVVEAVCPTFFGLIVLRLFCGAAGGVLQNVVDGIASDVWARDIHRRALSLSTYVFSLLAGVTSGTVFGSLVAENLNWRWYVCCSAPRLVFRD